MLAPSLSRRDFLKSSALAGGGLVLGFYLPKINKNAWASGAKETTLNAFVRITPDNKITLVLPSSEMGQGVYTSLPTILAEELDADLSQIVIEQAPVNGAYKNPGFGMQATGGSSSVRAWWPNLQNAGAAAREMLVTAAAKQWNVPADQCAVSLGYVIHKGSKEKLSYGEVCETAAKLTPPKTPKIKAAVEYRYIGKPVARFDTPLKVDGSATFGIDVKVPNMLHAAIKMSPVFGGDVDRVNEPAAKRVRGVKAVVRIPGGVAVVAEHYWQARKGLEAAEVTYKGGAESRTSGEISKILNASLKEPAAMAHEQGDISKALHGVKKKVEATYTVPFLAHATMEPMNCTAHVTRNHCEIWSPLQGQDVAVAAASQITGLPPEKISIHTTFLGGGFGRRFETDFTAQAVLISKAVGKPVKLIWSREEDMTHDFYRPASLSHFEIGLDAGGMPLTWSNRIVSPSIMSRLMPQNVKDGLDGSSVEGARDLPYNIPHQKIDYVMKDLGIPVGFWRSVGSSHNAYYTESMLDEVADAGKHDPYQLRRKLLAKNFRFLRVLDLAASKAKWGAGVPKGQAQGIAIHKSFGTIVAEVVNVSVDKEGQVRVHKVVCAVDCGRHVNPRNIEMQMESGIVYGLTAALKDEITINQGRVVQKNFDEYEMLRMNEMPVVETHIVPSDEAPGGVGEPGTPPIAPAVTNAIFALTRKRIRSLPIKNYNLKSA